MLFDFGGIKLDEVGGGGGGITLDEVGGGGGITLDDEGGITSP